VFHPKMKFQSLITHHVVPNLYDVLTSAEEDSGKTQIPLSKYLLFCAADEE